MGYCRHDPSKGETKTQQMVQGKTSKQSHLEEDGSEASSLSSTAPTVAAATAQSDASSFKIGPLTPTFIDTGVSSPSRVAAGGGVPSPPKDVQSDVGPELRRVSGSGGGGPTTVFALEETSTSRMSPPSCRHPHTSLPQAVSTLSRPQHQPLASPPATTVVFSPDTENNDTLSVASLSSGGTELSGRSCNNNDARASGSSAAAAVAVQAGGFKLSQTVEPIALSLTAKHTRPEISQQSNAVHMSQQSYRLPIHHGTNPCEKGGAAIKNGSISQDRRVVTDEETIKMEMMSRRTKTTMKPQHDKNNKDVERSTATTTVTGGMDETSSFVTPEIQQFGNDHVVAFSSSSSSSNTMASPFINSERENILQRFSDTLNTGTLTLINLSQRGLNSNHANLIKLAVLRNPHLAVLKLGYNSLGDDGAAIIASGIIWEGGQHHPTLSVLDLGFNGIGDDGCAALAVHAIAGNYSLRTLYLSGNTVGERGALSLAGAILNGCGLTCLHLTANRVGTTGVKGLSRAIAESEARRRLSMGEDDVQIDGLDCCSSSADEVETMQELHLGGTSMLSSGCLSVSNMLLTNFSIRVLSLSDNGIDDRDLALFSQSISRNKNVPLEVLQLSFNRLTCIGVESLMNAIWGSKTLKEIRLDNNRIRDRGAQLAAVVLTSVNLQVLDLGFNRITTVGVKALMKSLAENDSLLSLTLSGNPLDTNASKAVSFALAYNTSLTALYVDNCSIGFSAQRHIAAGIVSNSNISLRIATGFQLGAITVTLGLPPALEHWTNEQVLNFVRLMWQRKRQEEEERQKRERIVASGKRETRSQNEITTAETSSTVADHRESIQQQKKGPADPAAVIAAAKSAFASLGDAGGALLRTEPYRKEYDDSPLVPSDAIILERTSSGTVRVPKLFEVSDANDTPIRPCEVSKSTDTETPFMCGGEKILLEDDIEPVRMQRNRDWLKVHYRSLNEIAQLPFDSVELWQLHQYFFASVHTNSLNNCDEGIKCHFELQSRKSVTENSFLLSDRACTTNIPSQSLKGGINVVGDVNKATPIPAASPLPQGEVTVRNSLPSLARRISYRFLSDAVPASSDGPLGSTSGRRRSVSVLDDRAMQPASKRAKNDKPRIAYYPRIREKLELFRTKAKQRQALVLLRQLKYTESVMLRGRNGYSDIGGEQHSDYATTSDVEMVLVDML